ncbi:MAG: hypothetical protein RPU39_10885 [Candidatus Sedimenticola sp. (ex Thyasira tokunagai)]
MEHYLSVDQYGEKSIVTTLFLRMSKFCSVFVACLLAVSSPQVTASLVVDFGGDYVDTVNGVNRNLRGGDLKSAEIVGADNSGNPVDMYVSYFDYSLSTPLSPTAQIENPTKYDYDTTQPNAVFYGGAASYFEKAAPDSAYNIPEAAAIVDHYWAGKSDSTYDDIGLRGGNSMSQPNEVALRHYSSFVWKKEDFVTQSGSTVLFDDDSSMSLTVSRKWHGLEELRFLVMQGTQAYLSESTFSVDPSYIRTWGLTTPQTFFLDPLDTNWAAYDPLGYDLALDPLSMFSLMDFTDITAVGFYAAKDTLDAQLTWLTFSDFEVEAAVTLNEVPIPATFGLFLSALVMFRMVAGSKRRRAGSE